MVSKTYKSADKNLDKEISRHYISQVLRRGRSLGAVFLRLSTAAHVGSANVPVIYNALRFPL